MTSDEFMALARAELAPRMRLVCASMGEGEFQGLLDDMMRVTFNAGRRRLLDEPWGPIPSDLRDRDTLGAHA
ncbi:MAG: hypothetical protein JWL61_5432 [Gemmatimonadetes bacterium]|nr:hypothetical protein [Gemmatimonadota bacterium]